ncbi:MAG: phenylalanine--tRNA ligase subunit beta [Polyangiaceae bacterium]
MKASYNWIRELVPGLTATYTEVEERLTRAGLEVEGIHHVGRGLETCLVVAVKGVRPHPKKDSLRLVMIDGGAFGEKEVVCGAPNVPAPGGLVVLAPVGTHLAARGLTIEPRTIAGVVSEGMLCSEVELGIGDDGDGILILEEGSARPGTPLLEACPFVKDFVFEIGLTPNRPDGLGHLGLAREVAALFEIPWQRPPAHAAVRTRAGNASDVVSVTIDDGEACPHYGAAYVEGVTIRSSPLWVRTRLSSLGVRPISNVVDVTNLVMLETGHPMHAFDLAMLAGPAIKVRRAKEGEAMRTLDGVDRTLTADDLLICDASRPVALAGVMGGENTEIRPTTQRVLLECAYFAPRVVRRAARRHGIHTESSHRFERGVDWGDTDWTLARAAALVADLGGGTALEGRAIVVKRELTAPTVTVRAARLAKLLGAPVPMLEIAGIVTRLGFEITKRADGEIEVRVPSHRPDVSREVDLIEEVARVRGLDAIHPVLPALRPVQAVRAQTRVGATRDAIVRRAREVGVALGLSEALLYGFVARRALEKLGAPPPVVELKNPLTEAQAVMRTSLLPGLLAALESAQRHGERDVRLFASGPLFLPGSSEGALPHERLAFAALLAGDRPHYLGKPEPVDVWDAKGVALEFIERLLRRHATVSAIETSRRPTHLHPRGAASVHVGETLVGCFGPLHPDVADAFGVAHGAVVVELDLEALAGMDVVLPRYEHIARFPPSRRDIALVVKDGISAGEVESAVREAAGTLAEHVALFDRFVGGSVPAGHASLAFRIVYRAPDRTLTDAEVDQAHQNVVQTVGARFGAQLRA